MPGITKVHGQKHALDKFYTHPQVAKDCLDRLDLTAYDVVIEPAAGGGAFSSHLPGAIALDLHPEHPTVVEQDFFTYHRARESGQRVLVVGNPPFGQKYKLATRFINHAAGFADTVAFILPLSFKKASVQRLLQPHLHLRAQWDLGRNSFLLDGAPMHVPCVFQVWDVLSYPRMLPPKPIIHGVNFVRKDAAPNLYIQRVGGAAGMAGLDWHNKSEQTNYFVRVDDQVVSASRFVQLVNDTPFPAREWSVGPRSVSRDEVLAGLLAHTNLLVSA